MKRERLALTGPEADLGETREQEEKEDLRKEKRLKGGGSPWADLLEGKGKGSQESFYGKNPFASTLATNPFMNVQPAPAQPAASSRQPAPAEGSRSGFREERESSRSGARSTGYREAEGGAAGQELPFLVED